MKKTTHDITVPEEKAHYKKKYLLRKLQEEDAEKEIKEFDGDPDHCAVCQGGFCQLHDYRQTS